MYISIQYQVIREKVYDAIYKLTSPQEQVDADERGSMRCKTINNELGSPPAFLPTPRRSGPTCTTWSAPRSRA